MRVLIGLLLVLVVITYGQTATRLTYSGTYDSEIGGFDFSYTNPDKSNGELTMPSTSFSVQTDDLLTTGYTLTIPDGEGTWGITGGSTEGMVGSFYAENLNPGQGNAYYMITKAEIVFNADGCFSSDSATADFIYYNSAGQSVVHSYTVSGAVEDTKYFRFSVDNLVCIYIYILYIIIAYSHIICYYYCIYLFIYFIYL